MDLLGWLQAINAVEVKNGNIPPEISKQNL
jgi:hypothetical protein